MEERIEKLVLTIKEKLDTVCDIRQHLETRKSEIPEAARKAEEKFLDRFSAELTGLQMAFEIITGETYTKCLIRKTHELENAEKKAQEQETVGEIKFQILYGRKTIHDEGSETILYLGQDEKGLLHILAGDQKTSLKLVEPPKTSYVTMEDKIDFAFDECEEMVYSCINKKAE